MYLYELKDWIHIRRNEKRHCKSLTSLDHKQGRLVGRMEPLGFKLRAEASPTSMSPSVFPVQPLI